jgi:hypothetical protein
MMFVRLAVFVPLLFLSASPGQVHPPRGYSVRVISHSIELSLTVPRRIYPANALIRVTAQLRNVSGESVGLLGTAGPVCPRYGPGIQVINQAGNVVYPGVSSTFTTCGGLLLPRPLQPGQMISRKLLIILRAAAIQAVVSLGTPQSPITIVTPAIRLRLGRERAPFLRAHLTPPFEATIRPSTAQQKGSLYLIQSCSDDFGSRVTFRWTAAPAYLRLSNGGYILRPACSNPEEWYATAG